jgi:membrane dipeptidase
VIVIDAHEDLAWNALTFRRDYRRSVSETRQLEQGTDVPIHNGEALLGWPEWMQGKVAVIFSSLFATPKRWCKGSWDVVCYEGVEEAHRVYQSNLNVYKRWAEESPEHYRLILNQQDLEDHWQAWQDPEHEGPAGLILLMEGADGVREPAEVEQWFEQGVRILGPAWSGTRYAGGTKEPGSLTSLGRELLAHMDACGMILDLSHLTPEGALEAMDRYSGRVIASHSSPLGRVPNAEFPERLINDDTLHALAERGGVMGLLLGNHFLQNGWQIGMPRNLVSMQDVLAAIDYICQLLGSADYVALGSDFDGGFGLDRVPQGLDTIADLQLIGEALKDYGYSDNDVAAILGLNWYHLLQDSLPRE